MVRKVVVLKGLMIEATSLFPTATILRVLSFCVIYVGNYAHNYAQDEMHHTILQ